jgi:AAA domain
MNKTQTLTTPETLTNAQQSTNTHTIDTVALSDITIVPTPEEMLIDHKAPVNKLAIPFAIYQRNLAEARPQSIRWLWERRLPLAGLCLLDGDHGCGKSLLALQIAACVSSGAPLPDGSPTTQGGVVIVSAHTDATTTQLQLLTALQADLSRIEILSYIHDPETSSHPSGYRPFSLPKDLPRLFDAVERVNANIIIFDSFIDLLSHESRWTDQRLGHFLADLNQHLIERNIACLLIRNCPAKGGHARPSVLERSERFLTNAATRLLLAPHPMQPDQFLLSHAKSTHTALTPTLILQIQPLPDNPDLPHVTVQGFHSLKAKDLIENRPDTLHRRLLSQHLLSLIAAATNPIHVSTLYARSHNSSPFQIQRSLRDLLNMGQIERSARGFYTLAPANPTFPSNTTAATTPTPQSEEQRRAQAFLADMKALAQATGTTTTPNTLPESKLNTTATTTLTTEPARSLNTTATITHTTEPARSLNPSAATTPAQRDWTEACREGENPTLSALSMV